MAIHLHHRYEALKGHEDALILVSFLKNPSNLWQDVLEYDLVWQITNEIAAKPRFS